MEDSVRMVKEEFVSNLNGTTWAEVDAVQLMQPLCVLLLCSFLCFTRQRRNNWYHLNSFLFFLTDFSFTVLPLLLLLTVFADFMPAVFESSVVFITLLLAVVCRNYQHMSVNKLLALDVSLDYISWYRGYVNILTAICILAVDFRCYPRRLAKTETFGTGLMDIFVGAFIMCNSIVCKEARNININQRSLRDKYDSVINTLRSSLPLTILGVARLVTTKASNYQEHTSEYGVHWNFFLTLAATRVGCTVLLCVIRPTLSIVLSVSLAGIYQYLLSHGLREYILRSGGRDNEDGFISANREGIFSTIGYMSLYCAGVTVGQMIFRTRRKLGNKLILLVLLCVISGGALCGQIYAYILDLQVSRRLANLPFILWTIHHSVLVLAAMLTISIILNLLSAFFRVKALCMNGSELLDAVNYNGLLYFVLANLLTGAINICTNTLKHSTGNQPLGVHISAIRKFLSSHPEVKNRRLTTVQVNRAVIKSETRDTNQPFINKYIDLTNSDGKPLVAPATLFVSHAWKCAFCDIVDALEQHEAKYPDTYFWLDLFAIYQNRTVHKDLVWFSTTFREDMRRIRRVLLVLSPWDDPLPLHRSWCMFEVTTALSEKKIELLISFPTGEINAFASAIVEDQHSQQHLVKVLSQIQVQNTEAKYSQDKENILEVLKKTKGGFDCVNELIICEIQKWYGEQLCRLVEKFPDDASLLLTVSDTLLKFGHLTEALDYSIACLNSKENHEVNL